MDSTEAQLRYGSALSSAGDPGHPSHPLHASQHSARRERMTAREEASLRTLEGRRYRLMISCVKIRKKPHYSCWGSKVFFSCWLVFVLFPGERPLCWPLVKAWCQHVETSWTTRCPWCAHTTMSILMCFLSWTCALWNMWPTFSRPWFTG